MQCSITVNDNQEEVRHSKTKTDHNEQPNKSSFLSLFRPVWPKSRSHLSNAALNMNFYNSEEL